MRSRASNFASKGSATIGTAVVGAVLVLVAGAGWFLWQNAPAFPARQSLTVASSKIVGRGVAISGDTLRIAGATLHLDGIEAPVPGQRCRRGKSRRWNCGASATSALSRLVRRAKVSCEITGSDDNDSQLGDCHVGDKDIAAQLVRGGMCLQPLVSLHPIRVWKSKRAKRNLGFGAARSCGRLTIARKNGKRPSAPLPMAAP